MLLGKKGYVVVVVVVAYLTVHVYGVQDMYVGISNQICATTCQLWKGNESPSSDMLTQSYTKDQCTDKISCLASRKPHLHFLNSDLITYKRTTCVEFPL